jgi:hypothetical protein
LDQRKHVTWQLDLCARDLIEQFGLRPTVFEKESNRPLSIGLLAILDDVAAIAKLAAASLEDVVSLAAKAGVKAGRCRHR